MPEEEPMTGDPEFVTLIYQPEAFEPGYAGQAEARFVPACTAAAARAGFTFRVIPVHELIPACQPGRPMLWHHGEDFLGTRQCFQVDDFAPHLAGRLPARRHPLRHRRQQLRPAHQSADAPHHLLTDKFAMAGRAARLGIPAPATIAIPCGRHGQAVVPLAVRQLGTGPYIIKPRQMAMGTGVLKADTAEQLAAAVDLAAWSGTGHIIQPFEHCDGEVRAHYADGEVIAAQRRVPAPAGTTPTSARAAPPPPAPARKTSPP
jgi:hypothetical protein